MCPKFTGPVDFQFLCTRLTRNAKLRVVIFTAGLGFTKMIYVFLLGDYILMLRFF